MELGTLAVPRRLLLSPAQTVYLTRAPEASNAHGVLNLGEVLFDDLSPGSFSGSNSGTVLALNAPASFAGNLLDAQAAGTSACSVSAAGNVASAGPITATSFAATGLTGATAASRHVGATVSGAPGSGTFSTGDFIIDQSGAVRVCTAGGSPGTWAQPSGSVDVAKVSDSTSASAFASVTFSSIPATYRHLFLVIEGRGDTAAATTNVELQFNGVTTATYQYWSLSFSGTSSSGTITTTNTTPQAFILIGAIPAATATAGYNGKHEVLISSYANTTFFKSVHSRGGQMSTSAIANQAVIKSSGLWNSTAAISSIKVLLSAGNFVANSYVSLYGLA